MVDTPDTLDTPDTTDAPDVSEVPDTSNAATTLPEGTATIASRGVQTPMPPKISANDIGDEAKKMGCDAPAVWAVCDVESGGSGFLPDGRPRILFEAHIFSRLTNHQYDRSYPNISSPVWNQALYGASGAHQYDRLDEANGLDRIAALEAASWGLFQIMGFNYGRCGFLSADEFITAMWSSERAQLDAFTGFCNSSGLVPFLVSHDWVRFALGYNGPNEALNSYHIRLGQAYQKRVG